MAGLVLLAAAAMIFAWRRMFGSPGARALRAGELTLATVGGVLVLANGPLLCGAALRLLLNRVPPADRGPAAVSEARVVFPAGVGASSTLVAQVFRPLAPGEDTASVQPTMSCPKLSPDANPADRRPLPLILYIPHSGGERTDNRSTASALASHGYVVIAIDDLERRAPTGAAGPRPLEFNFSSREATRRIADLADRKARREAADALSVLDRLEVCLGAKANDVVNLQRVGVWGFSIGGAAAAQAALDSRRVVAAVDEDGTVYGRPARGEGSTPSMLLLEGGGVERRNPAAAPARVEYEIRVGQAEQKLWRANLHKPDHYTFIVHGAVHESFSDLIFDRTFLRNWLVSSPTVVRSERAAYLLAFFDKYLRGYPAPLLDRAGSPFGNVQSLRADAAWAAAIDAVPITPEDRRLLWSGGTGP